MLNDKLFTSHSIIISLDADSYLFEKLNQINCNEFPVVEINTYEPEILKKVIRDYPSLRVGAGNIINPQQLEASYEAGIHFASSPGFLPAIAQTASIYSINYIPGITTLSEAMQVLALGYYQAKPYPADLTFCNLLNKHLPRLRLFPADIEVNKVESYLNLPSVAAITLNNPEINQLETLSAGIFA